MNAAADSDPYAGPKSALRDCIKWLVAVFGALLAWTVGGVAVSNLGALAWTQGRFWLGLAGLLIALAFVVAALIRTVRLLQPAGNICSMRSHCPSLNSLRTMAQLHQRVGPVS